MKSAIERLKELSNSRTNPSPLLENSRNLRKSLTELKEWLNFIPSDTEEYEYALHLIDALEQKSENHRKHMMDVLKKSVKKT
jgi:hypothetical protein